MIDEHFTRESVDGIPVVHIVPSAANDRRRLALFLPFLGGTKERFDVSADDIAAGGVSMGGDIAVALAGVDHRVTRVGAVVATPDWTRPGMTRVGEPDAVIDQGAATPYGTWLHDHLDPTGHPDRYAHGPAIAFELGAADTHVPPASAFAFRDALHAIAPEAAGRVRITAHDGLDHLDAARDPTVVGAALDWMCG